MTRHTNGDRTVRLKDAELSNDADNEDTIDGMASYTDPSDSETRFYGILLDCGPEDYSLTFT